MDRKLVRLISIASIIAVIFVSFAFLLLPSEIRKVSGDFYLQRWEDFEHYYLLNGKNDSSPGGFIEGTVLDIGWDERHVVVKRNSNFRAVGLDGWMVIEVGSKKMLGPFTDQQLHDMHKFDNITFTSAEEAWQKLR